MQMHFTNPLQFKTPAGNGEFSGMLAVFDSADLSGDLIERGAFRATLAETKARGTPLPLLWSHDPAVVLGCFTDLHEDASGLQARGKLTLETRAAQEAYALLKDRAVSGLSIGYTIAEKGARRDGDKRVLEKIDLYEGSIVAVPMHPDARVLSVKSLAYPRELGRALREGRPIQLDALSRRKAAAAATALWSILDDDENREHDEDDAITPELQRELDLLFLIHSQLKR